MVKRGVKHGSVRTLESFALRSCKQGDTFYTEKSDKFLTAMAAQQGAHIVTERMAAMDTKKYSRIELITKVTVLNPSSMELSTCDTKTAESFILKRAKSGTAFYTDKESNHITSVAAQHNVAIKTERMVAMDCAKNSRIEKLVKVTIL